MRIAALALIAGGLIGLAAFAAPRTTRGGVARDAPPEAVTITAPAATTAPASVSIAALGSTAAAGAADAAAAADGDQASAEPEPVIVRPIPVPLPSAGLGGIALLAVMALWRSAALRSTRRLH